MGLGSELEFRDIDRVYSRILWFKMREVAMPNLHGVCLAQSILPRSFLCRRGVKHAGQECA